MMLKLYLVCVILSASQGVFSKQHLKDRVFKCYAGYSQTGANINQAYHRYHNTIANINSGKPIPAVVTTHFKIPAANVSTYIAEQQYSNILRVQNTHSNPFIILSNPANYNTIVLFKNLNKQGVKANIIDPPGGCICERTNKKDLITTA